MLWHSNIATCHSAIGRALHHLVVSRPAILLLLLVPLWQSFYSYVFAILDKTLPTLCKTHWLAASFFDPRPRGLHRRWHVHEDPRHSRRQSVLRGSKSDPARAAISVTTCLADLGSCTDCQHGGLLQLGSRCYPRPAARPAAVRLKCRCLFGFLSEAVRTHNPIASWTSLVESSGASHIPAVRSGLPLSSWNSAGVLCRACTRHLTSTLDVVCALLTQPCWWYRPPDVQHSVTVPSQWLRHVHGTACRRLSGMHRRRRRSVASWRLYFFGRRLTITRRSWLYCTV